MSSCQKKSYEIEMQDEIRDGRKKEISEMSTAFLRNVVINLCTPEGISGHIDIAFGIDRCKIISEVLYNLAKELEERHE